MNHDRRVADRLAIFIANNHEIDGEQRDGRLLFRPGGNEKGCDHQSENQPGRKSHVNLAPLFYFPWNLVSWARMIERASPKRTLISCRDPLGSCRAASNGYPRR